MPMRMTTLLTIINYITLTMILDKLGKMPRFCRRVLRENPRVIVMSSWFSLKRGRHPRCIAASPRRSVLVLIPSIDATAPMAMHPAMMTALVAWYSTNG